MEAAVAEVQAVVVAVEAAPSFELRASALAEAVVVVVEVS
jgi:hypothetical protein